MATQKHKKLLTKGLFCLFAFIMIALWARDYFQLDSLRRSDRSKQQIEAASGISEGRLDKILEEELGVKEVGGDSYLYKVDSSSGRKTRFYEFGDRSLGVFGGKETYDPEAQNGNMENAMEDLQVPDDYSRSFRTDDTILQETTMLSRFRPDDLDVLSIHLPNNNSNPAMSAVYDAVLAPGSHLSSLRKLELQGPFSILGLENININNLKKLDCLVLNHTRINYKELANMPILSQLRMLEISNSSSVTPVIKRLSLSSNLRILKLQNNHLTDKDVLVLKNFRLLEKLDLSNNPGITDTGKKVLKSMNLKELKI